MPSPDEHERILNVLSHSKLANVPQYLITQRQINRVLRGEVVKPTLHQKEAALRLSKKYGFY